VRVLRQAILAAGGIVEILFVLVPQEGDSGAAVQASEGREDVSDDVRRLTTDEQRERFQAARRRGGLCAACGRTLGDDEVVYIESFTIGGTYASGPVGIECASAELLRDAKDREPEQCAGCGRGMHYRLADSRRRRALCSRNCANRAEAAKRRQAED